MIKLKSLIKLNEQAPMDPMASSMGAPAPMQAPAPQSVPPTEQQPTAVAPEVDNTPTPEDPGEYDWTKDFRAFEDAKNKAEAQAKKKLIDKMNKQLVGKKITTNASRGYGQPKTDHTIESVKKISVEFWYKEWVVIVQDENDKKFFLTPGVNIKIEQGGEGEPSPEDQAPQEPETAQTGEPGQEEPNAVAEPEQPVSEPSVPSTSDVGGLPSDQSAIQTGATGGEQQPQTPNVQTSPTSANPLEQPPKKKKRLAEINAINKDLKSFLSDFMVNEKTDYTKYIVNIKSAINENRGASVYKIKLEIPINHIKNVDIRDIQLAAKESMWSSGNLCEQFSRGSVDIFKVGKFYIMEFVKQTGWKS